MTLVKVFSARVDVRSCALTWFGDGRHPWIFTSGTVQDILAAIDAITGTRTSFLIDGDAPILRERDTITAETANTPAKRLYLCVQTMYLKNDIPRYRIVYQGFLHALRDASPGDRLTIDAVNGHVSAGVLYKALKEIRKLVKREDELLAA